jgi:hypothetical protein
MPKLRSIEGHKQVGCLDHWIWRIIYSFAPLAARAVILVTAKRYRSFAQDTYAPDVVTGWQHLFLLNTTRVAEIREVYPLLALALQLTLHPTGFKPRMPDLQNLLNLSLSCYRPIASSLEDVAGPLFTLADWAHAPQLRSIKIQGQVSAFDETQEMSPHVFVAWSSLRHLHELAFIDFKCSAALLCPDATLPFLKSFTLLSTRKAETHSSRSCWFPSLCYFTAKFLTCIKLTLSVTFLKFQDIAEFAVVAHGEPVTIAGDETLTWIDNRPARI